MECLILMKGKQTGVSLSNIFIDHAVADNGRFDLGILCGM